MALSWGSMRSYIVKKNHSIYLAVSEFIKFKYKDRHPVTFI